VCVTSFPPILTAFAKCKACRLCKAGLVMYGSCPAWAGVCLLWFDLLFSFLHVLILSTSCWACFICGSVGAY
jgi:hypothetical protein